MKSAAKQQDLFENIPEWKAILELAFPSIAGQIILVIYNMADTLFVGMSGSDAMITAVAVCMPAYMFLSAISNLFGVGGASVISRALGQKDGERARRVSAFSVWGCLAVTLLYSLGALAFVDGFVDILGGSDALIHMHAKAYLIVTVVIGGVFTSMNMLLSHLIRAEGRSLQASLGIALGGVLNIVLDPLFMFVILQPGNEALGAAVATTLSNVFALLYFVVVIYRSRKQLTISVHPSGSIFRDQIPSSVISVGLPACLMTLCENISYAILDNLMAAAGTAAQAGIGVAKKVNMLTHCIVRGMSQGVLPLIGYNYASGNYRRMKKVIYLSGTMSIVISLLCTTVFFGFSTQLIELFIHSTSESVMYGATFLKILCIGAPFSACAYAVISFFQATGKGTNSLILALLRKGILDIPLMFLLRLMVPVYGIVCATPVADILCSAVSVILFAAFMRKHRANPAPLEADIAEK